MPARKQRPNHRLAGERDAIASNSLSSRFYKSANNGILLLLIVTATTLIFYEARYSPFHIKTVAGDNLKPTPWHKFRLPRMAPWDRLSRFPTIVKCTYLSCHNHTLHPIRPIKFRSNSTDICPTYFQYIHEDLSPWRHSQITTEQLKSARQHAAFRVIIVGGRLYIEFYYACVLPRALFTLWGLVQLLERYRGMVPDVDLMFDCMDSPSVKKADYKHKGPPPPLFRYCGHKDYFDIAFPDWSFWGWPQTDLRRWAKEVQSIYKASKLVRWEDRKPNAYWKGNPNVGSKVRKDLLKCNNTKDSYWGAEIFLQDWWTEFFHGYKDSKLSQQCKHRYKIYAEGHAWSVSFKYIFACNSPVLVASPTYHEFFTRGLIPMVHYCPIRRDDVCPSIKLAVNWGNQHTTEAKAIGNAGQEFMWRNLTMDHVYDYMFHLLNEYAKLQRFKPEVPSTAQLLCKEGILCFTDDPKSKEFLKESQAKVSSLPPCTLASYDGKFIKELEEKKEKAMRQVWMLEDIVYRNK